MWWGVGGGGMKQRLPQFLGEDSQVKLYMNQNLHDDLVNMYIYIYSRRKLVSVCCTVLSLYKRDCTHCTQHSTVLYSRHSYTGGCMSVQWRAGELESAPPPGLILSYADPGHLLATSRLSPDIYLPSFIHRTFPASCDYGD